LETNFAIRVIGYEFEFKSVQIKIFGGECKIVNENPKSKNKKKEKTP